MGQIWTMPHNEFYKAIIMMFEQPMPQPIPFYQFQTCKQPKNESTSEFLSRLQTLQADCKYDNFNAETDLAYRLTQNCYSQDTQKQLFLSHAAMLDVYLNIMQAVESAECSSHAIPRDSKDVHAVHNNSHGDSDRYINYCLDQSTNRSKCPQSPMMSKHCWGRSSTHHTCLSPHCKAKDSKCYDCGLRGHFAKYWEQRQGKSNPLSDEGKAVKTIHLGSVTHSAAASYKCTFCVIHLNEKDCYTSSIVDSGAEASLLLHLLYRKWIGAPLSKLNAQLFSFNNTEIAGLKGQFIATMEYNGHQAKVTLLVLDTIKVGTWGTDTIEVLQLVINGATQQINFVQPIDLTPPAPAVQPVQSTPAEVTDTLAILPATS
uniref:CCHC-type domain-containing protein n=1 Tax=Romanomermis culicivorax TaxID=13658 RepID=A0A915KCT7_ROMCU